MNLNVIDMIMTILKRQLEAGAEPYCCCKVIEDLTQTVNIPMLGNFLMAY